MTDAEVTTKIEAIRKELRDGRNSRSISGAAEDSERYTNSGNTEKRAVSKQLRSNDVQNGGNIGSLDSLEPGFDEGSVGRRRRGRRPGQGNSGPDPIAPNVGRSDESGRATTQSAIGNLVKDDDKEYHTVSEETVKIPRIVVPRSVGRPRKAQEEATQSTKTVTSIPERTVPQRPTATSQKQNPVSALIGKGKTLTEYEAKSIKEPFRAALDDDGHYIDQLLMYRTGMTQPIWGDMDDDELDKLTGFMLKQGQRSPIAATAVRGISEGSEYLAVGAIVLPRVQKTVEVLRTAHIVRPKLHKSRLERIKEEINNAG